MRTTHLTLPFAALSLFAATAGGQSFPGIPERVPVPWIETPEESGDRPCTLDALEIKAEVVGLFARTSATLSVRNPNPRPISAPVAFPLPDGAVVCGYALESGGAMLEGVAVPKETARVAFETEQRRGIDPGLVESVKGNVWRTRVYPVPAGGTRRVRVDYVAPLAIGPDGSSAALDLPMPDCTLARRAVTVEVADGAVSGPPALGGFGDRRFERAERFWRVSGAEENVAPRDDLLIGLPVLPDRVVSLERTPDGDVWFCASAKPSLPMPPAAPAAPAEAFTVLWDASGSRAGDHSREFDFLRALRAAPRGAFRLVVFRNVPEPAREFGSVEALVAALAGVAYDGGTDLAALAPAAAAAQGPAYLFTDGMDTLSGKPLEFAPGADVSALLSGAERDAEALRQACGGRVFDPALSPDETVCAPARRVRGLEGAGFADVQGIGSDASRRATVIGRLTADAKATLRFDHDGGGAALELRMDDARPGATIATAWAAARVQGLAPRADDNAAELLALGRRFGLASPVASLLVLETLDQWLRHDIEPPASQPEMRERWLAEKKRVGGPTPEEKAERHFAEVARLWKHRMAWWNAEFPVKPAAPKTGADASGGETSGARPGLLGRALRAVAGAPRAPARSVMSARTAEIADDGFDGEAAMAMELASPAVSGANALPPEGAGPAPESGAGRAASVTVKPWSPDVPYRKALDAAPSPAAAREAYLSARAEWASSPAFFLDCAGWFFGKGDREFAVRVLSNLAELRIEDPALLRVMAWRLKEAKAYDPCIVALRRVCRLRPEEPQSWRDLALALDESGRASGDAAALSEALSLYRKVALRPWDRHSDPASVFAVEEHNALLAWCEARAAELPAAPDGSVPGPLPEELRGVPDCDLRVVLSWDADETDLDLHVTEPGGEEAFYGHRRTSAGGDVSRDVTDGYGPEEYMIRRAPAGAYRIRAHYFASHRQEIFGPATATATAFTDWGRPEQAFETVSVRLDRQKQMVELGSFSAGKSE